MRLGGLAFACLLAGTAAVRAVEGGLPAAVQGLWVAGDCAAPKGLLFATHRGWARLPAEGVQQLWRVGRSAGLAGGHTLAVGNDPDQTRLLLRPLPEGLEVREPPPKLADAELPGEAPATLYRRCAAIPAALAALHGEGLSFLAALDGIEAACTGGDGLACLDAVWAWADVSGDGLLTAAELARLARGVAYAAMLSEGASSGEIAAALGAGALGGVVIGWALIASFDYDGSASLSKAEVMRDRFPPPGLGGAVTAVPPRGPLVAGFVGQLGALRSLFEEIAPLFGFSGR